MGLREILFEVSSLPHLSQKDLKQALDLMKLFFRYRQELFKCNIGARLGLRRVYIGVM